MEKNEYFVYYLEDSPLFVYRKGRWNEERDDWDWYESKEYFSGLDCKLSYYYLDFFNGKLHFNTNFKNEAMPGELAYDRFDAEEFLSVAEKYMNEFDKYSNYVKAKLTNMRDKELMKKADQDKIKVARESDYKRRNEEAEEILFSKIKRRNK